ncbi:hypothetical protein N7448_011318 [Penicillium atrosanguineum]|nr:hypothetical protein N7448_011318 [Penicillium atrosanguineum]
MPGRQIEFDGDDAAYIRYLEALVLELRQALQSDTDARVATFSRSPGAFDALATIPNVRPTDYVTTIDNTSEVCASGNREEPVIGSRVRGRLSVEAAKGHDQTFHVIEYTPSKGRTSNAREKQKQYENLSKLASRLNTLSKSGIGFNGVCTRNERAIILRGLVQGCSKVISSCLPPLVVPTALSTSTSGLTEASILSNYAQSISTVRTTNRQAACIQELIFVSMCAVALRNEEDAEKDNIYKNMREVFQSDAGLPQLQKLIRGAKWANSAVSLLTPSWKTRSWDLLIFGMFVKIICLSVNSLLSVEHPVSYYARLSDSPLKPEELIKMMNASGGPFSDEFNHDTVPLAVPLIIEKIFRNCVSYVTNLCHFEILRLIFHTGWMKFANA